MTPRCLPPDPILLVGSEPLLQDLLLCYLRHAGLEVETAGALGQALAALERRKYRTVISNLCLSGRDVGEGLRVLRQAKTLRPECRTVLLTGYGGPEVAREAARMSVDSYLEKPPALDALGRALGLERNAEANGMGTPPTVREAVWNDGGTRI